MNLKDFNDARQHIYGLAHNLAPNKDKQNILIATLQHIERESKDMGNETILRNLLYVLMDGLTYGNWPWQS